MYFLILSSKSPKGSASTVFCLTSNQKREPSPNSLLTFSFESIISRILTDIAMPRPVPSMLLLRFSSILSNAANSFFMSSFLIPIPVSSTSNRSMTLPSSSAMLVALKEILPLCVYLTAFESRLERTCRSLISSP